MSVHESHGTAPTIDFALRREHEHTARSIRDAMLASNPDELVDRLALAAIDLVEQKRALCEALSRALGKLNELDAAVDDERERRIAVLQENAELRRRLRGRAA